MSVFIVFSPIPGFAVEATGSVRDCCRWRSMRRCGPSRSASVREELMDSCTNSSSSFFFGGGGGGGGATGVVVCRLFLLRFVFLLVPLRFVFLEVHSLRFVFLLNSLRFVFLLVPLRFVFLEVHSFEFVFLLVPLSFEFCLSLFDSFEVCILLVSVGSFDVCVSVHSFAICVCVYSFEVCILLVSVSFQSLPVTIFG